MGIELNTANDNAPVEGHSGYVPVYGGDALGRQMLARERAIFPETKPPTGAHPARARLNVNADNKSHKPSRLMLALCLWIGSLALCYIAVTQFITPLPRMLAAIGAGWASLFLAYVSKQQGRAHLRDIGLSAALSALGAACLLAMAGYNIPAPPALLAGAAAFVTIIFASLLRETYFLTISSFLAIVWTGTALMDMQISPYFWVFPALASLQLFLSIELKSKLPIFMATLSLVFWVAVNLFILSGANQVSGMMGLSALFVYGTAHARIGKSMQDSRALSGLFQTNIGWMIAAMSALGLQSYWQAGTPSAELMSYPLVGQWAILTLAGVIGIAVCCVLRMRKGTQTLLGGLGVTLFAFAVPASVAFAARLPEWLAPYGLSPVPHLGLIMGGVLTGLALGMVANGLKRRKVSMILIGIAAICAEAVVVADSLLANSDNMMVFGMATLFAALTAALYAYNGHVRTQQQVGYA